MMNLLPNGLLFAYNYHMIKLRGNRIRERRPALGIKREDLAKSGEDVRQYNQSV
jgi:hypothetical protein